MPACLTYIIAGFLLGLTGLIPGPLLTLVISESLKHGAKAGIRIAASPLITDLPIILAAIFIMSRLANTDYVLGTIAFGGSLFLIYLSFESFSFKGIGADTNTKPDLIKKGVIANLLNPSPYVFWFTIGAPTIIQAFRQSLYDAILFLFVFYSVLVGSKVVIAVITGKVKNILSSKYYLYLIRFLGVVLFLFALFFIKNGIFYFL